LEVGKTAYGAVPPSGQWRLSGVQRPADSEQQLRVDLIHSPRAEERAGDYGTVETDHRGAVDDSALCLPARQLIVTEIDRGITNVATPESRIR
jgi:hypothetical protein